MESDSDADLDVRRTGEVQVACVLVEVERRADRCCTWGTAELHCEVTPHRPIEHTHTGDNIKRSVETVHSDLNKHTAALLWTEKADNMTTADRPHTHTACERQRCMDAVWQQKDLQN